MILEVTKWSSRNSPLSVFSSKQRLQVVHRTFSGMMDLANWWRSRRRSTNQRLILLWLKNFKKHRKLENILYLGVGGVSQIHESLFYTFRYPLTYSATECVLERTATRVLVGPLGAGSGAGRCRYIVQCLISFFPRICFFWHIAFSKFGVLTHVQRSCLDKFLQLALGAWPLCLVDRWALHYENLFCQCNIGTQATQAQVRILNEMRSSLEPVFSVESA